MLNNLKHCHKDKEWLLKELQVKGYALQNIILATLDINEKLVIYERNLNEKVSDVLE